MILDKEGYVDNLKNRQLTKTLDNIITWIFLNYIRIHKEPII